MKTAIQFFGVTLLYLATVFAMMAHADYCDSWRASMRACTTDACRIDLLDRWPRTCRSPDLRAAEREPR